MAFKKDGKSKKALIDVPWDKLPHWVEVVGMELCETWWGFRYLPRRLPCLQFARLRRRVFLDIPDAEAFVKLGSDFLPRFPGDWKDSIIIRPGCTPVEDRV